MADSNHQALDYKIKYGTVKKINRGEMYAVDPQGNVRTLEKNSTIFLDEQLKISSNTLATIELGNGQIISIPEDFDRQILQQAVEDAFEKQKILYEQDNDPIDRILDEVDEADIDALKNTNHLETKNTNPYLSDHNFSLHVGATKDYNQDTDYLLDHPFPDIF